MLKSPYFRPISSFCSTWRLRTLAESSRGNCHMFALTKALRSTGPKAEVSPPSPLTSVTY